MYYISTVNTQHMQRRDVLLQLGYNWRHVSAVKRPSSGQYKILFYLIVKPTHAHFQFLFIKIYLKFLKIILHVSVIRPSSGSF